MNTRRAPLTALALLLVAVGVAGCSPLGSPADPATVIPDAFDDTDLGIVEVYAATTKDGFSDNLFVQVEYDLATPALELGFPAPSQQNDISFFQKMGLTDEIIDSHR